MNKIEDYHVTAQPRLSITAISSLAQRNLFGRKDVGRHGERSPPRNTELSPTMKSLVNLQNTKPAPQVAALPVDYAPLSRPGNLEPATTIPNRSRWSNSSTDSQDNIPLVATRRRAMDLRRRDPDDDALTGGVPLIVTIPRRASCPRPRKRSRSAVLGRWSSAAGTGCPDSDTVEPPPRCPSRRKSYGDDKSVDKSMEETDCA